MEVVAKYLYNLQKINRFSMVVAK